MRLDKYQKSKLLEYEWDVFENESPGNTRWFSVDVDRPVETIQCIMDTLGLDPTCKQFKILTIATQPEDD